MLARILNVVAQISFAAHNGRVTRITYVVALAVSIGLITLAQPDNSNVNHDIYDPGPKVSVVTSYGRYVRLTGALDRNDAYQTEMDVGPVTLRGSRFIRFNVPGVAYDLYIIDQDIPAPKPDGTVTVIGQFVAGTGQQPNLYFEPGLPPNVGAQNTLARAGIGLAVVLAVLGITSWLIRRVDYAPGIWGRPVAAAAPGEPEWLWYGSLGVAYGNAIVRQAPVEIHKLATHVQWTSAGQPESWSVIAHRLLRARPVTIAGANGPRPGMRIQFEDERGLVRHGTLVAHSAAERDALLADLERLRPAAG